MKLIDLLVQELPKRGGWVDGANEAVQDANGDIKFFDSGNLTYKTGYGENSFWGGSPRGSFYCLGSNYIKGLPLTDEHAASIVTRDQYEAALKPVWNGEGLPPVGVKVELMDDSQSQTWGEVTIKFYGDTFAVWDDNGSEESNSICNIHIRPLSTEAERKREDGIDAIYEHYGRDGRGGAAEIYDAIAAGKIPGIKLE